MLLLFKEKVLVLLGMWNSPLFVTAFILGIVIIIISLLMFILPKKNSHLVMKFFFDICYILQMIFIFLSSGSYLVLAGISANVVGAIRDIAFIKNDNKEYRGYWTIGLSMLMIGLLHFTYASPISYLPVVGTLINTTALSFKNKKNVCALTLIGQIAFISYYILLLQDSDYLTILNIISASMLFVSALSGLVIYFVKNRKKSSLL